MENENKQTEQLSEIDFSFLAKDSSQKYFAETDFALRQGRHIQNNDIDKQLYSYIESYFDELKLYYQFLLGMVLKEDYFDTAKYYYLDFEEESYGKFGSQRTKVINDKYLLIGILFLNLYNEKHFEVKRTNWNEITEIITEKEKKDLWLRLLFPDVRNSQTASEWKRVKGIFKHTIDEFAELGWVKIIDKQELEIEINPSIYRIVKLYPTEIENISLLNQKNG